MAIIPTNFCLVDRDTAYHLLPTVDQWLPDNHLTRIVVEIVDELDISALKMSILVADRTPTISG